MRRDPLTGRHVVLTAGRQHRPNLPSAGCPFCPGGFEAPDDYRVRWFVNRWPAMPDDRCEVILYSARHDASFWELGVEGAVDVIDLWAERTAALGDRADVAYVLAFENRGAEVGATIAHPHGQIYAFEEVPPAPLAELAADACAVCTDGAGDGRLVSAVPGARSWSPAAPAWPFELLVAPEDHVADLVEAAPHQRQAIAEVLVDSLHRLDVLFSGPMPYMLWVHQRPTDGGHWPRAHVHVHVAPLFRAPGVPRFVAAGELGGGVYFNPVEPGEAARRLKEANW